MPNWGIGAGGLLGGLAEGMRANREHALKMQALEIQKQHVTAQQKLLEVQAKEHEFKAQQGLKAMLAQDAYANMVGQGQMGQVDPSVQFETAQPGQTEQNAPGEMPPNLAPAGLRETLVNSISSKGKPGDPLMAARIRMGNPNEVFKQTGLTGGASIDPMAIMAEQQSLRNAGNGQVDPTINVNAKGQRSYSFRPHQDPREAANAEYQRVLRETRDPRQALQAANVVWAARSYNTAGSNVTGNTEAKLGEYQMPQAAPAQPMPEWYQPPQQSVQAAPGGAQTPAPIQPSQPTAKVAPGGKPASRYLDLKGAEATATEMGKPLESTDRTAISAMEQTLKVAQDIKREFSQPELERFTGYLRYPAMGMLQSLRNDPKFARFQTLTNMAKAAAFGEGGKQLTPLEAKITFGHIPTGSEFSVSDFVSNLNNTIEQTQRNIETRINLGKTPRKDLTNRGATQPAAKEIQFGNKRYRQTGPGQWAEVQGQ